MKRRKIVVRNVLKKTIVLREVCTPFDGVFAVKATSDPSRAFCIQGPPDRVQITQHVLEVKTKQPQTVAKSNRESFVQVLAHQLSDYFGGKSRKATFDLIEV